MAQNVSAPGGEMGRQTGGAFRSAECYFLYQNARTDVNFFLAPASAKAEGAWMWLYTPSFGSRQEAQTLGERYYGAVQKLQKNRRSEKAPAGGMKRVFSMQVGPLFRTDPASQFFHDSIIGERTRSTSSSRDHSDFRASASPCSGSSHEASVPIRPPRPSSFQSGRCTGKSLIPTDDGAT